MVLLIQPKIITTGAYNLRKKIDNCTTIDDFFCRKLLFAKYHVSMFSRYANSQIVLWLQDWYIKNEDSINCLIKNVLYRMVIIINNTISDDKSRYFPPKIYIFLGPFWLNKLIGLILLSLFNKKSHLLVSC